MTPRRCTLPDGTEAELTRPMVEALAAMPTDGFAHAQSALRRLQEWGLVHPSAERNAYVLTPAGRAVRGGFPDARPFPLRLPAGEQGSGGAEGGSPGLPRPSADPGLDGIDRRRIRAALAPPAAPAPLPSPFPRGRAARALASAGVLATGMLFAVNPLVGAFAAGAVAAVAAAVVLRSVRRGGTGARSGRAQRRAAAAAEHELALYRADLVLPGDLDEQARAVLVRCQQAVDSVLGSHLHAEGLLLDGPRNAVVLDDVEWSVARGLARHTAARAGIRALTAEGLRDGAAAERARAELAADVERIERRVATVEGYARRVLRAELDHRHAPEAQPLHDLADDLAGAGAARPHEDAALDALVEARRSASDVAALTADQETPRE